MSLNSTVLDRSNSGGYAGMQRKSPPHSHAINRLHPLSSVQQNSIGYVAGKLLRPYIHTGIRATCSLYHAFCNSVKVTWSKIDFVLERVSRYIPGGALFPLSDEEMEKHHRLHHLSDIAKEVIKIIKAGDAAIAFPVAAGLSLPYDFSLLKDRCKDYDLAWQKEIIKLASEMEATKKREHEIDLGLSDEGFFEPLKFMQNGIVVDREALLDEQFQIRRKLAILERQLWDLLDECRNWILTIEHPSTHTDT